MLTLIKVSCSCGKQIQVMQAHAGQDLKCPVCGQVVSIPRMGIPENDPTPPPGWQQRPSEITPSPAVPAGRHGLARVAGLMLIAGTAAAGAEA